MVPGLRRSAQYRTRCIHGWRLACYGYRLGLLPRLQRGIHTQFLPDRQGNVFAIEGAESRKFDAYRVIARHQIGGVVFARGIRGQASRGSSIDVGDRNLSRLGRRRRTGPLPLRQFGLHCLARIAARTVNIPPKSKRKCHNNGEPSLPSPHCLVFIKYSSPFLFMTRLRKLQRSFERSPRDDMPQKLRCVSRADA